MIRPSRWLVLLLPLFALLETCAHLYFAKRAPAPEAWQTLRAPVERLWRPGDAVVVAPNWADPLARAALASEMLEVGRVRQQDLSSVKRAVEISIRSASSPRITGWRVLQRETLGPFDITLRENERAESVAYDFVEAAAQGQADAQLERSSRTQACRWATEAARKTGGLHGAPALPRARFECGAGNFAGVSILDDQEYRPRRCVLVSVPASGEVVMGFDVRRPGSKIVGSVGSSYFLTRSELGSVRALEVRVDGRRVGEVQQRGAEGFVPFSFAMGSERGGHVEFRVRGSARRVGHEAPGPLCFEAEMR